MNIISGSALSLRRRSVWEAADSGVLLWRDNFVYFIPFFAIPVWIAACALRFLPEDLRFLSYLILWWLKPLFDRPVLHVVSRRFFGSGADSRLGELCRGLPGTVFRGLLGDLLWRRFSPGRAAYMPVRILEGTDRKQYSRRKNILAPGGLGFCFPVSVLGLALEGILLLGEIAFFNIIVRMFFPSAADYMRINREFFELLVFAAFSLNLILIESLYVCMGFGLYINSRVEVEGWDLQLLFGRFARRAAKAALMICLVLLPALPAHSETAEAEGRPLEYFPRDFPSPAPEAFGELEEILASPDFGGEKESWGIRFREGREPEEEIPEFDFAPWMEQFKRAFGVILRALAVLVIAAFAGFAAYRLLKERGLFTRKDTRNGNKAYTNPFTREESPEALFAKSEDFYRRGLFREAWAACLAGNLGAFSRRRSLSFPPDATEYGCLDLVRAAFPVEAEAFRALVDNWILLAYGGKMPAPGSYERAVAHGRFLLGGTGGPHGTVDAREGRNE